MSPLADELRLLAHTDAAAWGAVDLTHILRELDGWLERLQHGLGAGLAQPPGLQAAGALARQAEVVNRLLQDCRARWTRQWAGLQPAQALADDFDGRLMLLVFGRFNAGKSSLCNFLAERFAAHGRSVRFFHLEAGRIVASDERLREGATETTARLQGVCLGERLVLLDTPGLHSVTAENAALTQRFTDSADGVLWLTSSTSPGQVQELDELARELRRSKPLLPVLTRSDVIEEDEIDGEIRKCLRNKTPANRALQEADVQARARDKLRLLDIDLRLLEAPVSVSAHAAREQGQTAAALQEAGFARLYAALSDMLAPAQAYKQRKPAEVLLHHLQEHVLGGLQAGLQPALAQLRQALEAEREALEPRRARIVAMAWRGVIPELPRLLDEHAPQRNAQALCAEVALLVAAAFERQAREQLDGYGLPPAAPVALALAADAGCQAAGAQWDAAVGDEALHTALAGAVQERLASLAAQAVQACAAALDRLEADVGRLQDAIALHGRQLPDLERQLRGCTVSARGRHRMA